MLQVRHHIRHAIRRDMGDVQEIERLAWGEEAWPAGHIEECLKDGRHVLLVCGHGELIIGFALYKIRKTRLELLDLAVHPVHQWQGVARRLADHMKQRLTCGRKRITASVPDVFLDAHLFLRHMDFLAVIDPDDRDSYLFTFNNEGV